MTTTQPMRQSSGGYVDRPQSSSLADVINIILDKGLVIDAYVRVSLVGIELLTIDARIVVASVDTYLRFAEATSRLNLGTAEGRDLPEVMQSMSEGVTEGGSKGKVKGAIDAAQEKFQEAASDDESEKQPRERKSSSSRRKERE